MHRPFFRALLAAYVAVWVGCGEENKAGVGPQPEQPEPEPDLVPTLEDLAGGYFAPLAGYELLADTAGGYALLARGLDGYTTVTLKVSGLQPNTAYPAHVHNLPCAYQGGGHYKLDPSIADTEEANEVWPQFTTDAEGHGWASLRVNHMVRDDGQAVVIHDPDAANAKMFCADLYNQSPIPGSATGTFAPFAASEAIDATISGTVSMIRAANRTTLSVTVSGLAPAESYGSHVHAYPCAVYNAGGHYKLDPTIDVTDQANEIWPALSPDAGGSASDDVDVVGHQARGDAQSVVIHRIDGGNAPKVACADLKRRVRSAFKTTGDALLLPEALARGITDLEATAQITRGLEGQTEVNLTISGLSPETKYPAHVHNQPCVAGSGGGHYKIDTAIADTVEDNEIWVSFTTDSAGAYSKTVKVYDHTARADAQSIVVHDTDAARLACIDLR